MSITVSIQILAFRWPPVGCRCRVGSSSPNFLRSARPSADARPLGSAVRRSCAIRSRSEDGRGLRAILYASKLDKYVDVVRNLSGDIFFKILDLKIVPEFHICGLGDPSSHCGHLTSSLTR